MVDKVNIDGAEIEVEPEGAEDIVVDYLEEEGPASDVVYLPEKEDELFID